MFSHDKLKVYQKALASVARLAQHSVLWDKRHSVVDQLLRASESIVLNIAEGARLRSGGNKQHLLDYAMGSALECAACFDIAVVKQFLLPDLAIGEKRSLCEVVKMLMGLRSSWANGSLREEPPEYPTKVPGYCAGLGRQSRGLSGSLPAQCQLEPAQRQRGAGLLGRIALMTGVMSRG